MTHKVALLGLGIMGSGIAGNLLKHGFALTVYNRTRQKSEPFADQGAQIADTPRAAVHDADVVISVVGDDTASHGIWLGENGALAGVKSGAILLELSTLTPHWVRELAKLAAEKGCSFLDAPMAGSKEAAANAQIGLLVGGDEAVIAQAQPVFDAISRRQVRIGEIGAGATWKLINNMMIAAHVAVLTEGLALAEAADLKMDQVVSLILGGATASMIVQNKLPRMQEQRYVDTDFSLKWMDKDVRYALHLAHELGVDMPTIAATRSLFHQALAKGLGDQDFAAVVEALRD